MVSTESTQGPAMTGALALIAALRRWWRPAVAGAALIAFGLLWLSLKAEQRQGRKLRQALAAAEAEIAIQNARIEALAAEGARRQTAAQKALASARRANADQAPRIAALRRSAAAPRAPGPCTISDTLRATQGL
jgi:hypothetical protein